MKAEEREIALYCLKASSDYHSEVCEECIKYPNCDHTMQDDVTETIIKALEQQPCEDCISRQTVKKQMIKYGFSAPDMTVTEFVEDLPSVKPATQWHKVKEELPEENGVYFACYEDATVLLDWFNGRWFIHGRNPGVETGTVIAWMPLPKPYKTEN